MRASVMILCALPVAALACGGERVMVPATLSVYPTAVTVIPWQPRQMVPGVRTAEGTVLSGRAVTWSSANPEVAAVDSNGLVIALSSGETTVTASLDTLRAEATITVPGQTQLSDNPIFLASMPQFPGPQPPQWTTRFLLAEGLVTGAQPEPLGEAFDRIGDALRRAGVFEWATYGFGDSGFAMVARLEHIGDDGFPLESRWSAATVGERAFTLQEYLRRLFVAQPGRYRVIVFVVTHHPLVADTAAQATERAARGWLQAGAAALPAELRSLVVPGARTHALVYEFFRPTEDAEPVLVVESRTQGPHHLIRAGLWPEAALLP